VKLTRRALQSSSLVALLAVLTGTSTALAGQQDKLDRALRLNKSSQTSQRVIVEVQPGQSEWVRVLLAHRGRLSGELNGSLTANLSAADLEALCEANAPYRLAKPKPIHAKRAQKTNWGDPVMRARLANAYVRAGGDNEKAARILGVSIGSARLAKRRHLDAPEIDTARKLPSGPEGARQLWEHYRRA